MKIKEIKEHGYNPILLNNELNYDPYNGHFWGEFWLESLDPCHRPLEEYKKKWATSYKENKTQAPFFLWLEQNEVSAHHKRIDYLEGEDLENSLLLVKNGKLFNKDPETNKYLPLTTKEDSEALFIINHNKEIYMVYDEENYRHISISHGMAVIGAGTIEVKDGTITRITTNSGHYLPNIDDTKQLIKCLKEIGLNISLSTRFDYFSSNQMIKSNIKDFESKNTRKKITKRHKSL